MIRFHVSAICCVRDGYTGKAIQSSALRCRLDQQPCRPVGKPGGYLALVNLLPGKHLLSLQSFGFQEERLVLDIGRDLLELNATMKPDPRHYPLPENLTCLTLGLLENQSTPAGDFPVWLAEESRSDWKISQTQVDAGSQNIRLFRKSIAPYTLPDMYLLEDGPQSEIVRLTDFDGETGFLDQPLQYAHDRNRPLLPAQRYRSDTNGKIYALFSAPGAVAVFSTGKGDKSKILAHLDLSEGQNSSTILL